jgi:hypothetical protein
MFEFSVIQKQSRRLETLEWRTKFFGKDKELVEKTMEMFSVVANSSPQEMAEFLYPTVMHIGDEICVRLSPDGASVGVSPVYCYDSATMALTRHWNGFDE